jgi:hypothetical protein
VNIKQIINKARVLSMVLITNLFETCFKQAKISSAAFLY